MPDEKGNCGCPKAFSLDAIPKERLDGIARSVFPHIAAYFLDPANQARFKAWLIARNQIGR